MSKEMAKICDELERELKAELREFKESMEKDRKESRRNVREARSSMDFIIKVFKEIRSILDVVRADNAELKKENQKLESLCWNLSKRVSDCECRLMLASSIRETRILKSKASQKDQDLTNVLKDVGEMIKDLFKKVMWTSVIEFACLVVMLKSSLSGS